MGNSVNAVLMPFYFYHALIFMVSGSQKIRVKDMAFDIGPKIGIEGEAEFRKSIQQINTNLKTLGTEMAAVVSGFDKGDKSQAALAARSEVLNKQVEEQKKKLEQLQAGLAQATDKYGETDKVTQGWQQSVNKATADLNNMERELSENNKALGDVERGYNDAGQKLDEFGNAAEESGPKFEALGTALKATGVAIAAVAAAAGAAALAMTKEVVQSFGELEQNLGGSEAVFGEYAASIQKTGEDAYKNLGVSQSDYLATANKMGALFQGSGVEQQKSLELTEQAMQRAADMASVMGIDMQVALDSVAGAAKGNFTMMDNLGVAMNATNIEAYALAKGLDFTWKTATQAEKAEVAMQMFFENTEQYAGNFARESTQTVTGSFGLMSAAVDSFVGGLGNSDADMQKLTQNLVDAFQAVVSNVVPIIENLTAELPGALSTIVSAVKEMLPDLLETATDLFRQVLEAILNALPELIPVVVEALDTIVDALIENLPLIIDGALALITALADGMVEALPELVPSVVEAVTTIAESLVDNLSPMIDSALDLIMALADGLINALPVLVEKAPTIISELINGLVENLPKILQAGVDLITKLGEGLIEAIPQLVTNIPQIITAIVDSIGEEFPKILEIGKDVVRGIWDGIKSMAKWLGDQVSGFFSGVIDDVKGFLGIHSPSRVFAKIGENMAAGIGVGFGDQMRSVARQINGAIPVPQISPQQAMGNMLTGAVNGMAAMMGTPGGTYIIQTVIDGRVVAEAVFDPLKAVSRQRGVSLA